MSNRQFILLLKFEDKTFLLNFDGIFYKFIFFLGCVPTINAYPGFSVFVKYREDSHLFLHRIYIEYNVVWENFYHSFVERKFFYPKLKGGRG